MNYLVGVILKLEKDRKAQDAAFSPYLPPPPKKNHKQKWGQPLLKPCPHLNVEMSLPVSVLGWTAADSV